MRLFARNGPRGICKPTKRRSKSCACGALLLDWLSSLKNQQKDAQKLHVRLFRLVVGVRLRHLGNRHKSIIKFSISNYKHLRRNTAVK